MDLDRVRRYLDRVERARVALGDAIEDLREELTADGMPKEVIPEPRVRDLHSRRPVSPPTRESAFTDNAIFNAPTAQKAWVSLHARRQSMNPREFLLARQSIINRAANLPVAEGQKLRGGLLDAVQNVIKHLSPAAAPLDCGPMQEEIDLQERTDKSFALTQDEERTFAEGDGVSG